MDEELGGDQPAGQGRTARGSRAPRRKAGRLAGSWSRHGLAIALVAPAAILVGALVAYPLARTIWLSFTDTGLIDLVQGGGEWVGLDNYREVFTDEALRRALINTVVFGTVAVADDGARDGRRAAAQPALPRPCAATVLVVLPWRCPRSPRARSGAGCSTTSTGS